MDASGLEPPDVSLVLTLVSGLARAGCYADWTGAA